MSLGTDYQHAEGIIERALDNGITYFDTADVYDKGVNEEIVGKALKNIKIVMISLSVQKLVTIAKKMALHSGTLLKIILNQRSKNHCAV